MATTGHESEAINVQGLKVSLQKFKTDKVDTVNKTWAQLKAMRDGGTLAPGQWYRIIDYQTTTTQVNTQSAGHQFDVIVRADAVNVLNENAYAAKHAGDTYFTNAGAKLEAWELKYCIDNDTTNFAWADSTNGKGVIYWMKDEWDNECPYDFKNILFPRYRISECEKSPDLEGLFAIDGANNITVDTDTTFWCYTFCMIDTDDDSAHDVTVEQNVYMSDEGFCFINRCNVFKPYYLYSYYDEELDESYQTMSLPNNVMVTDTEICCIEEGYGEFYGYYNNTFGFDCYDNTIGNFFQYNTIGNSFYENSIGNDMYYNTIGNYFQYNTIGNNFYQNSIGNTFQYNTIGNNFYQNSIGNSFNNNTIGNGFRYNSIGNNFYQNSIGNNFVSNTIGNGFYRNTIGNEAYNNTIGNSFYENSIGNDMYYNTIGNGFVRNTIGNDMYYNTIGNSCQQIRIQKDYVYYVIIENGNQYIDITSTQTTSGSSVLRNFTIAQGVNNTSTRKTISHNSVNDTFKTTYQPQNSQVVSV